MIRNASAAWVVSRSNLEHTCSSDDTFKRGNMGVADYMAAGVGDAAAEASTHGGLSHGVMSKVQYGNRPKNAGATALLTTFDSAVADCC